MLVLAIMGLMLIGCKNENPSGFYKFYDGDPIGDVLKFDHQNHHLVNDTIFFKEAPIGKLVSTKKSLDGNRFITVKELNTNRQATYVSKQNPVDNK